MELYKKTAHELLELYRSGGADPQQVVESVYSRIDARDEDVKAYVTLTRDAAMKRAAELKDMDRNLPLYGVPVAVKDNMCTEGVQTTCGSKILNPYKPPYDATVVQKIKDAGAVIIGKVNMDEFAMGSSCEHSAWFPTKNPWDTGRVPGGSSGGSAAAVSSCECAIALGSDTGGSIRQPASFCGIVGLKPTYGVVSRFGLVAFASSLDQIGPMTRDVEDCAVLMNVIAGHDERDSTSVVREYPDYTAALTEDIRGLKVGVIRSLFGKGIEPDVAECTEAAVNRYKELGAKVADVEIPSAKFALTAYYLIAPAEASSNLARYDGVQYGFRADEKSDYVKMFCRTRSEGFGDEVKRRIMLGTYALSAGYYDAFYNKALKVRTMLVKEFAEAFSKFDILVSPTVPDVAFRLGEKLEDPLAMYMNDICTIPVNLAGLPAISIPCGLVRNMPVGLHIIGPAFGEETLLRASYAYEKNSDPIGLPE